MIELEGKVGLTGLVFIKKECKTLFFFKIVVCVFGILTYI